MTWILFLVVSSSNGVASTSQIFENEISCMKALGKLLEMENRNGIKIQARCVKQ